ncbi:hypothetical protein SAMN05216330_12714 [Bradyrhizobium sp. Ghvi]|uniref:hypothetical protein n=1 Tax=Bradyrhizobium sp. Ghvi TaxID=1855319 RepID=UPI0008DEF55C|nr:hypothetical protein [Bradyrhizobium sp. Ghvi]SFQ32926.1 hypothetical protein SAMN05216330_12714 [Bradyrhizobium sp. Ghvi]
MVEAYEEVNGRKPNIFAAHLWDSTVLRRERPTNHNRYDEHSALLIKAGGKFRLASSHTDLFTPAWFCKRSSNLHEIRGDLHDHHRGSMHAIKLSPEFLQISAIYQK